MLRLLLVVPLLLCAQTRAAVTSQHPGPLQQALGDAARALQRAENLLKDATPSPSSTLTSNSVVQDWSLVCKELCGAGLGVTPCANSCAKSGRKTAKILNKVFDLAKCEQRHGLQTGSQCDGVESVKSYGARLCTSFCHQRNHTLPGCSPCRLLRVTEAAASHVQSEPTHGSMVIEEAVEQAVATNRNTTSTAAESRDSETPDWDEVCKTLCKTGDGGSLCNCDLSPFFS